MTFKIVADSENYKSFLALKNIDVANQRGIKQGFYFSGKELVRHAKQKIKEKPRQGQTYYYSTERKIKGIKKLKRLKHVSSRAGEYPANWTGKLVKSLDFNVHGWDELSFGVRSEDKKYGISYGIYLERGTKKMDARPFIEPTIRAKYRDTQNFLEQEINKAILAR